MRIEKHRLDPLRGRVGEFDRMISAGKIDRIGWFDSYTCYFDILGMDDRGRQQRYRITLTADELDAIDRNLITRDLTEEQKQLARQRRDALLGFPPEGR